MSYLEDFVAFKPLQTGLERRSEALLRTALALLSQKYVRSQYAKELAEARVSPQVRLADVIDVDRQLGHCPWRVRDFAFKGSFDLLVSASDGQPLFAVEADGPSHQTDNGRRRDALKDAACSAAMFPLLRLSPKDVWEGERRPPEFAERLWTWLSIMRDLRGEVIELLVAAEAALQPDPYEEMEAERQAELPRSPYDELVEQIEAERAAEYDRWLS